MSGTALAQTVENPHHLFQYLDYLLQIFDLVWHHVIIKGNIYARQEQGKSTPVVGHK